MIERRVRSFRSCRSIVMRMGMRKRVYVGVSGGMDSAAAVLLLKERGYEVVGILMRMWGEPPDAGRLSDRLGIEVKTVDVRREFERRVVQPFIDACLRGETPSPCVVCNASVKWRVLHELAPSDVCLATGHYCRVVRDSSGFYRIARGKDPIKDQSYYLWRLPQEVLSRAVLPLGDRTKAEVRTWLSERGFSDWACKKESMGVCFLEGDRPGDFLVRRMPGLGETLRGGPLEDAAGNRLGTHEGYPFYTAAQRRGLSLAKGRCVVAVDVRRNAVTIGSPADLFVREFRLREWRLAEEFVGNGGAGLTVKVRGVGENPAGGVEVRPEGARLAVRLTDGRAWALAKGQPAVFYAGDRVVGGGIIEKF